MRTEHVLASERIFTSDRFCPPERHQIIDSMILSDIMQKLLWVFSCGLSNPRIPFLLEYQQERSPGAEIQVEIMKYYQPHISSTSRLAGCFPPLVETCTAHRPRVKARFRLARTWSRREIDHHQTTGPHLSICQLDPADPQHHPTRKKTTSSSPTDNLY